MKDILQREINTGDLVVGMVISRNSDGMRLGVYNGSSVDFLRHNSWIITSVPSNLYLITNPTKEELEVKAKIIQKVTERDNERKVAEEAKKALKRIPKKDLVIGGYYRDDTDRTFFYLGHGTVRRYDSFHRLINEENGFIYLRVREYNEKTSIFVETSKSLRKIVAKEPNSFKVFELNLNNLKFTAGDYYRDGKRTIEITLDNK